MEGQSGSTRQVSLQIPFNRLEEMYDCNNLHSFLLYCKELLYFSNNSQSVSDNGSVHPINLNTDLTFLCASLC